MISKYTLLFMNTRYEKQYRDIQSSQTIQEYFIFTFFILGYCILSLAEFIINGKTIYSILSFMVSILSIFLYQFVKKYTLLIDIVLILNQLIIAISFKIQNFISPEERIDYKYAWYFGFQCCFFHFYVYIQGNNFIQQSIVLSIIFAIHVFTTNMKSLDGMFNFVKCVLIFIIMVAVKYTYQKSIKLNFLQTIQYKKFNQLLQNEVNSWTMLLSLDKLQDQIVMNWCNSQFKKKFNFQDNVAMRKFIRSLDVKSNSIENQIRIFLKESIPNHKMEFQINYQSHNYNIQLISIENQEEELCLFLLTPIKRNRVNNVRLFLEQFLQNILKKVIQIQQKQLKESNQNYIPRYLLINQSLNMLQLIQNKLPQTKQLITSKNISEFLNTVLGSNYSLNCYFQQFVQNQQLIFQLLLLLFDLILKSNQQCFPTQMNISFIKIDSDLIEITLIFYLEEKERFIDWFRNPNPDRCRSIYSSLNQVLEHSYMHRTTKDVSFNVISMKHILNEISPQILKIFILQSESLTLQSDSLNLLLLEEYIYKSKIIKFLALFLIIFTNQTNILKHKVSQLNNVIKKSLILIMLSTFSLKFVNKKYEKQFQDAQSVRILSELFNFTLFTMGYCLLSLIEFTAYGQTVYTVISSAVLILSAFIYLFIKSYNSYIDYILTFYQLLIAIIFEMDNLVNHEEKSNNQFAWFYGFQCSLFHFCAFIQGNNFVQSSFVLFITFFIHMIWIDINSIIGIMNALKTILLFFIMIAVKYTYLKLIKVDFFKNSQQQIFNELLEVEINSWTMLLTLNKQQDQIVMNWCNKQFQLKYKFQDDASMRSFVRSLTIYDQKSDKITIEKQIRNILIDNNLNQKFEFLAKLGSQKYKIRLVPIENQNERFCLFLLIPIRNKKINNVKLFIEHFIRHILKKVIQLKLNTTQQLENNLIQTHMLINKSLNMLQLLDNKYPKSINQIMIRQLTEFLNSILGNKYTINCYFQQFNQNYQLIYQLFLTLFDLILKSNLQVFPSFTNIMFRTINDNLIQLTLTFQIKEQSRFIGWFRYLNPDRCRSTYSSLNQILEHQYLHKTTKDISFNVTCLKCILNQISPQNKIKVFQRFENIHVVIDIINVKT